MPRHSAPTCRQQAERIQASVRVCVLRGIAAIFNVKRLVVVMMMLSVLPMQGPVLDIQRLLGKALCAQHG